MRGQAPRAYPPGVFGLQISVAPREADGTGPLSPRAAARAHAERINAIQRFFVDRTRLGIPIIPFEEAVHGLSRDGATMFPQAIGLAAPWDTNLMSRGGGRHCRRAPPPRAPPAPPT